MTLYVDLGTGAFGLSAASVRAALPHVSFPDGADLTEHGFAPYAETPRPAVQWCETAVEIEPEDGEQRWQVIERGGPLGALKAERLAALADLRWQKTQAMPAYDGATDVPADTARSVITSKVLAAQFMTDEQKLERHAFKLKPGEWRSWNLPDLVAYGLAIGTYMQACFDREQALTEATEAAADLSALAGVDIDTGWPA